MIPTAIVTFTNLTVGDTALGNLYVTTLDVTGYFEYPSFRKGTYSVKVELDGYVTDDFTYTSESVWGSTNFTVDLLGDLAPPVNLTVVDDEIYYETNVVLNWKTGASSEFHGYNVFRFDVDAGRVIGELLNDTPLDVTTYTDAVI